MEKYIKLSDIESFEYVEVETVYDIGVEGNSNYYISAGDDMLVHNSAKTWDIAQFLILYCQNNEGFNKSLLIFRKTYADCKDTVLFDFVKILKKYGLYDIKNHTRSDPQAYNLFGNIIKFRGLDNMGSHGKRNDVIWGNEGIELESEPFKQLNMRCNELVILDYNPSVTQHWIYDDIIPRPDCNFIATTQLHNPFLPDGQRSEILAYEPTHPEDRELPTKKRRQHPTNVENGTADARLWAIYGLGLRTAREGVAFPDITWVDEFPRDIEKIGHGQDFGYTNDPSALVKSGVIGNSLYLELLIYEPTKNATILSPIISDCTDKKDIIWCDSADPVMISDLTRMGHKTYGFTKFKGSIKYGVGLINSYKVHIVENHLSHHFRKEQENYGYKVVKGEELDELEDKWNHAWDAARYTTIANHRKTNIKT